MWLMVARLLSTPLVTIFFAYIWLKAVWDDDEVEINVYMRRDDDTT